MIEIVKDQKAQNIEHKRELPLGFFYFKVGPFQDENIFKDYNDFVYYMLLLRWRSGIRGEIKDDRISGVYSSGCIAR